MEFRFPQPGNEDAFEHMCLRLYRRVWNNDKLQLYAKRGENQHGVDIYDPDRRHPIRAVQCKHHERTKTLPPSEIKAEVAKAEASPFQIEEYFISTTARKSRKAQDTVIALNDRPNKEFNVFIEFWEEIDQHLSSLFLFESLQIITGQDASAAYLVDLLKTPHLHPLASQLISGSASGVEVGVPPEVRAESAFAEALEELEQLFKDRNFDVARHVLGKLPASEEEVLGLSPADQYMIVRLRAKLAFETFQYDLAGTLFVQAYELQPDLEQAKQNRVLGYCLIGESGKAFELASQYIAAGLDTPIMLCRLIDTAPSRDQLDAHVPLIERHLATSEEINVALCHKRISFGEFDAAAEAAKRALQIAPTSPHAHFAAALPAHNAGLKGNWTERQANFRAALAHYDTAIEEAQRQNYRGLLPEVYVNRATVRMMLGDRAGATTDYHAAIAASNEPATYAAAAASFFVHEEDFASAKEVLPLLDMSTAEGRFLTAMTGFNSATDEAGRRDHLTQMRQLADEEWSRAVECRLHCVYWALLLKDPEFARACITDSFIHTSPFQAFTALAFIALQSGDREDALKNADKALEHQGTGNVHPEELRLLAEVLTKLGQHGKALGLFEQVAPAGRLNSDTKRLIICAQHVKRHDILRRVCRELRETGEQDEQMRQVELQLCNRYRPEEGLAIVDDFIARSSTPAYFVAFKNFLLIRLRKFDSLELDPSRLPAASELRPEESHLVVAPYLAAQKYDDSLRFLYQQLRANFDNGVAHVHLLFFFFTHGTKSPLPQSPAEVVVDSAVLLEDERGGQRWVIIENDSPAPSRSEFSSDSPLGRSLLGCKVGDSIELPGSMQPETLTIREILSKYLHGFVDCRDRVRERFPDISVIQMIHVGSGDSFDPTPILHALADRREYVQSELDFYRDNLCPMHVFAHRLGMNELQAVRGVAYRPNVAVKCCHANAAEFDSAVQQGVAADVIVLDLSALITLSLLNAWNVLDVNKQYIMSQLTRETIAHWEEQAKEASTRQSAYSEFTEDGQHVLREITTDNHNAQIAELEKLTRMVDERCVVRSSATVDEVPPDKREAYADVLGFHHLESICLAKDLNAVLWSDDFVLSYVANVEFGVNSLWTQALLKSFVTTKAVTTEDYELVSAKLCSWDYATTRWDTATVIRAGEHAEWDPNRRPFKQCIALIDRSGLTTIGKAKRGQGILKALRQSNCNELRQTAVVQAVLNAINDRTAVELMQRNLHRVFRVDVVSEQFLHLELEYWLSTYVG